MAGEVSPDLYAMNQRWAQDSTGAVYKLTPLTQIEALRKQRYRENWRGQQGDFTFSVMANLHEVYDKLTTAQCGYLMLLQCYVGYDGGTLLNGDKSPMKPTDMMRVLQLHKKRSTFYDFLNACLNNGIIVQDGDTFAVNQRYHFRGALDDKTVVKTYSATIKRVYREVKAADIGMIYRMLPYVHLETNALCANPNEQDPDKITWFNRKELAQAIGVDPDTLGRRLPRMTFNGKYVVARIKVGNSPERYTFNPDVFYRKSSEPDNTLKAMFNVGKPKA